MGDVSKGFLAKRTPKYSFLGGTKPIFFLEKNMGFAPSLEFNFPFNEKNCLMIQPQITTF